MRQSTRTRTVALALAVAALAALLPAEGTAAGLAPAFALELLDGKAWRLADYLGSPVILIFWAPW